jgi:N utilization substance protein B
MSKKPSRQPLNKMQEHIARRRVARRLAMIGTYQWLMTGNTFEEIYQYFQQDLELAEDFRKCDAAFFHKTLRWSIENTEQLEALLNPHLDRKLAQVDMIEHAVMRIATCELLNNPETPYKVVVNESVNLTKKFGAEQAHKFVNGILDKVACQTRPQEFNANQSSSEN